MSAEQAVKPNPEKDLSDWTTGDEAMTGPQVLSQDALPGSQSELR
jgi:hypothetical protein